MTMSVLVKPHGDVPTLSHAASDIPAKTLESMRMFEVYDLIVKYIGVDVTGWGIFLVGDKNQSRALAVDPKDMPGVVILLHDNGEEINLSQPHYKSAYGLMGSEIAKGPDALRHRLFGKRHHNSRLANSSPSN